MGAAVLGVGAAALLVFQEVETVLQASAYSYLQPLSCLFLYIMYWAQCAHEAPNGFASAGNVLALVYCEIL